MNIRSKDAYMNPTNANSLDPKLKEVYDRVMGTSVTPSTLTPSLQTTAPTPLQSMPDSLATAIPSHEPTSSLNSTVPPETHVPIAPPVASPPRPAALSGAPQPQSAVDYAALAAKYATPPAPSFSAPSNQPQPTPVKAASVTPSTTTYGVVNTSTDTKKEKAPPLPAEKGGNLKKIMLILGILMFLVIYAFVWVVVFGIELPF